MTLNVTQGYITVGLGNSGVWIVSGNVTGTVVLAGDAAALNNLITGASTGFVRYIQNVDNPAPTTTLTITVNDQGNTGSDPGLTGNSSSEEHSASVLINVTAVNDAPVLDNAGDMVLSTITEDQTTNGGNTVAQIIASAGGDRNHGP